MLGDPEEYVAVDFVKENTSGTSEPFRHTMTTGDDGLPDSGLVAELNHLDDLEVDPEQEPPFVGDWEPAQPAAEPLWEESMFSDIDFSVWLGHLATKYSIPRDAVDELLHGFRALLEGT